MRWIDVDTAVTLRVNILALTDDTDFKTREIGIVYNESGMDLVWNFETTAGVITQTAVTPTTSGDYDWAHIGDGLYKIEMTASGGVSANNNTKGFGYFTGLCDGVLHWTGPTYGFRAAALNDVLIDNAYSATRGLAGTSLPDAAADGAGGLAISDAGGLDLDTKLANTNEITVARMGALTDWINGGRLDLILDAIKAKTDLVALETTLTAMKGAGWTTETLVVIKAAIDALIPTGARTITLQYYETATTDPVVGVKVTILNNAETVVVADRTTDINGQIVIALDDDTYKLRARDAGFTPAAVPETIVVSADATEILYGDSAVISAPSDSDVCRVYEYLYLPDGETNPTTVTSRAEIIKLPYDKDSKLHSGDANEGTYNSSTGLIYWDIVRGATAKFFVKDFIGVTRVVPDVPTQRLTDIALS